MSRIKILLDKKMDSYNYYSTAYTSTAYAIIKTGPGILHGMYVCSTSSGTILFADSDSSTAYTPAITTTITPAIGYHPLGDIAFTNGLVFYGTGTLRPTILYK